MLDLERKGRLNRAVEGLPRAQALADLRAANRGLTRPELAVITAYGKLELSADIVASPVADDPYFFRTLEAYFPEAMTRFGDQMNSHRLKREIIATVLANAVVDKAGPTFAQRILFALDGDVDAMLVAFETALRVFRLDEAWREVDGLDYQISAAAQLALYQELARSLRGQTYWLAKRAEKTHVGVRGLIDAYRPAVDVLQQQGMALLSAFERAAVEARCRAFVDAGAPAELAGRIALLRSLADASGIADLARAANWPTEAMARLYYETGSAFGYDRLRAAASAISAADGFERAALRGLIIDLVDEQVRRTREIAEAVGGSEAGASAEAADKAVAGWIGGRTDAVERARRVLDDIEQTAGGWSFAKLTIASAALRGVQG
jgi:glutamate dehydrogenase